ncbi:MAG: hypothetical protein JJU20_10085 [Opitutales bacterium]|nr:hypothetical protein [Opitutales bacterium]
METYLYFSLLPEALIYSQLPPERFGKYLAIGDKKTTRGSAIFFAVDPAFESEAFRLKEARDKCTPHADGSPRRSTYVSVYGVLANLPIESLGTLYLTTKDGLSLEIKPGKYKAPNRPGLHLYQELCPVSPKVASPLEPLEFSQHITNPQNPVYLPRAVFCDLRLNGLATDPEHSSAANLPYRDLNHLRECLTSLKYKTDKMTKIVQRDLDPSLLYYTLGSGFYVGDPEHFAYYPMPSEDDLENKHLSWWTSASSAVSRF